MARRLGRNVDKPRGDADSREDDADSGPTIAQGIKTLGSRQTAYDVEVEAIEAALSWYQTADSNYRHMLIHSDSTSAIARKSHSGAKQVRDAPSRSKR
jgi:hypothetical protein